MIKFVEYNFEVIKNNFYNTERNILMELDESDHEIQELIDFLDNQIQVFNAEDLISVINDRSLAIDLNNEKECNELFEMIKNFK